MKTLKILLACALCSCLSVKNEQSNLPGRYYRVKLGDTLSSIGKAQNLSFEEIMEINGIEDQRSLRVGQELFLPDPDPIGSKVVSLAQTHKKILPQEKVISQQSFEFPVPGGKIFREFSRSKENPYDGIGISAKKGTSIIAAQKGHVLFVGDDGTKYGLLIILEHEHDLITVYTHLERALVKTGDKVELGTQIGVIGNSGIARSPRLHFQVRHNQKPQNPRAYIKSK